MLKTNKIKSYKSLKSMVKSFSTDERGLTVLNYVVAMALGSILTGVSVKSVLSYLRHGQINQVVALAKNVKQAVITGAQTTSELAGDTNAPSVFLSQKAGDNNKLIECAGANNNESTNAIAHLVNAGIIQSRPSGNATAVTESALSSESFAFGEGIIKTSISAFDAINAGVSVDSAGGKNVVYFGGTEAPAVANEFTCAEAKGSEVPGKYKPYIGSKIANTDGENLIDGTDNAFSLSFDIGTFADIAVN